jgi:hypothetical protein
MGYLDLVGIHYPDRLETSSRFARTTGNGPASSQDNLPHSPQVGRDTGPSCGRGPHPDSTEMTHAKHAHPDESMGIR